mgnify:CR=1 FL=1
MRVRAGLPSLRVGAVRKAVLEAFGASALQQVFCLVHYWVRSNYCHLLMAPRRWRWG